MWHAASRAGGRVCSRHRSPTSQTAHLRSSLGDGGRRRRACRAATRARRRAALRRRPAPCSARIVAAPSVLPCTDTIVKPCHTICGLNECGAKGCAETLKRRSGRGPRNARIARRRIRASRPPGRIKTSAAIRGSKRVSLSRAENMADVVAVARAAAQPPPPPRVGRDGRGDRRGDGGGLAEHVQRVEQLLRAHERQIHALEDWATWVVLLKNGEISAAIVQLRGPVAVPTAGAQLLERAAPGPTPARLAAGAPPRGLVRGVLVEGAGGPRCAPPCRVLGGPGCGERDRQVFRLRSRHPQPKEGRVWVWHLMVEEGCDPNDRQALQGFTAFRHDDLWLARGGKMDLWSRRWLASAWAASAAHGRQPTRTTGTTASSAWRRRSSRSDAEEVSAEPGAGTEFTWAEGSLRAPAPAASAAPPPSHRDPRVGFPWQLQLVSELFWPTGVRSGAATVWLGGTAGARPTRTSQRATTCPRPSRARSW